MGGLKFRNAFTLAEVLITLAIIGVVAAITMPVLINNYQKKLNIVRLKKTYSVLSNAVKYLIDSGMSPCNESTPLYNKVCNGGSNAPDEFKDEFVKLLAPIEQCGYDYTGHSCNPSKDSWQGTSSYSTIYTDLNGRMITYRNITRRVLLLKDGTIVHLGYLDMPGLSVTVDVNGINGPNVLSKDLFIFIITPKGLSPYGSPDTDARSHEFIGYFCDEESYSYSPNAGPVGIIYMAAGAGCTAKYLLE